MDLELILTGLERKKIEYDLAREGLFKNKVMLIKNLKLLADLEKALAFLIEVAKQSQKESIEYIEKVVTYCIQLYGKHWKFEIEVKQARDQQEFHFWFCEGDIRHSIKDDILAGGIIDMADIGLRIARHTLDPEAEPILFLDEPMKNLGDKIEEAGFLLKEVIKERNIQTIIITHDQRLMAICNDNTTDKTFKLKGLE